MRPVFLFRTHIRSRNAMRNSPSGRHQRIPLVVRGAVNPIGAVRVSPRRCPRESAARLFPLFPLFPTFRPPVSSATLDAILGIPRRTTISSAR